MGTKYLLILFSAFFIKSSFAFDYKVKIRWNAFEGSKYNFSIVNVIDARLNKDKSIGSLLSGWYKKKTVGNDSLGPELTAFFKAKRPMFDTSTKIILVIKQLNIRYLKGYSMLSGRFEAFENVVSLDYYKIKGNTCALFYQQYFRHKEDATNSETNFAINFTLSETLKFAFNDFNDQLKNHKSFSLAGLDVPAFCNSFNDKPKQVINNQNIKDGIYLSCRDFYLNQPTLLDDYNLSDNISEKPITIKSSNGIIAKAFAIVLAKKIFIYVTDNKYREAVLDNNASLSFTEFDAEGNVGVNRYIDLETGLVYK